MKAGADHGPQIIDGDWARDEQAVYRERARCELCDAATFRKVGKHLFADRGAVRGAPEGAGPGGLESASPQLQMGILDLARMGIIPVAS